MRGRKPRGVELKAEDIPKLEALLHSEETKRHVARRARILLGMHRGERVKHLSERVERDPSTLWYVCRRYEERGIDAVYNAPRSDRSPQTSASQAGTA